MIQDLYVGFAMKILQSKEIKLKVAGNKFALIEKCESLNIISCVSKWDRSILFPKTTVSKYLYYVLFFYICGFVSCCTVFRSIEFNLGL